MSDKNNPTYIFQNKKTKEIMWFMPIAKLLKFLSAKELGFDLYNASGNTCQINLMLSKVINKNKFLANIFPKFTNISISEIHRILKESSRESRDGWTDEPNPVSIIKWFNNNLSNNSTEYNRELALSCSGVKDFDMVGVIYNDFLSKYFDKASDNGKNHMDCLYYRNFNIKKLGKLVTGMSNFTTETCRSELLKQYCFLDIDMCIYDFSDYQDKNKTRAIFKLITENVFLNDNQEYNLYQIDAKELSQFTNQIDQQISNFLKQANSDNNVFVEYDTETRRFLMLDENEKWRDATAYLYTMICDYLKKNNLSKPKGKLRDFVKSRTNSNIINKVTADHYQEEFNLVKNIAEYFESDLLDSALKTIEFTKKEKTEMKKYFFDKSPLEFFFKNPNEIKSKLGEDKNDDVENHPDKEYSITRYILEKNIDELLTEQGKEFLSMVKKIASDEEYFKDRIKKDETFEEYRSQNGMNCTYKNNTQNKKTKIEFSVLKALIESIDSGSNVAYQNFFVQLSYYLNYFFCNEKKLSKNELRNSIKKEIDEINKKISDISQKQYAREKEVGNMVKDNLSDDKYQSKLEEINKAYGTKMGLILQLSKAQDENKNFKKTIFFRQEVKLSLEAFDDNDQATGLNKFEKYFLGYDEKIFGIVRPKIKEFVKANGLFQDKAIEATEDKERIDIKTEHLTKAIQNYLGGVKGKITFGWFNLYVNYVCQHAKMECEKIMDGVVNQNDLEKDPDGQLDFLIIDTIIGYKKALEEIESDTTGKKQENSCNDFGVMNLFHLLQSFINAGYIFSYDLKPDDMRQYIYNAHEIEFLMNHHPKKLIKEIREKKNKSVDGLINNLFKNVSFVNDKLVKKMCKMSVYTFSKVTASVDHMTQINMAQFFLEAKGIKRNFSNGVMLDENGSVGCFMVPIQKALEICKNIDIKLNKFNNMTLPELPKKMKWADIDQECDLFFDQNKYKMLSPPEVASIFFSDYELITCVEEAEYRFCFLEILIQRHKELFKDFLCLDKHDDENLISVYIKNCNTQSEWDLDDIKAWFLFINKIFSQEQSGKKIGLNAIQQFVSLINEMTYELRKIISDNNKDEYIKNEAKSVMSKCQINIIANLIKNNYTQSGTQKILDDNAFENLFMAFCRIHSIKEEKDEAFDNIIMFLPDEILSNRGLLQGYGLYSLRVLIQKHPGDWKKFLESNSADSENLFNQVLLNILTSGSWWLDICDQRIKWLAFINKIIESQENDKKIGLNALEQFMQLIYILSYSEEYLDKVINIITDITGNIYFAWNNIIKDENQKDMLKSIFEQAIKVLNNVHQSVSEDDILKNQDLILWLYLIYKKIYFDSDFLKTQQTNEKQLNLSETANFLKEYKISDGDEKISEKNIFYSDNRTKEFINKIRELKCSGLIPLVDVLPKVLEKKQVAQQRLAKLFRKYNFHKVSTSIKSIPDELTSLALHKDDSLSVFSAVKTLYKMKRYDDLKHLLLSEDYKLNIVRKLFLECQDYSEKSLIIEEFPLNDIHKSQVEGIGIVIKLLLEKNMSISFYQGNSLLYEIQKWYQLARGEFETKLTNKQEIKQFFKDTWKQYFDTNKNIFDVAVDIISRITFYYAYWCMKNSVYPKDHTLDLRSMAHRINEIIMSECMSKNEEEKEKVYSNHKDLILWLYMLYTKIYLCDESLLKKEDGELCYDKLCDYRIDDIIKQVKGQTLTINYKCIDEFLKWLSEYSCQFIQDMIDNGAVPKYTLQNIYEKICDTVNDGEAYWRLNKSKIKELILSDEPDDVMNKLFSSFSNYNFTNTINKYEKFNSILIELDKIDFKLSSVAIKMIGKFRDKKNDEDMSKIYCGTYTNDDVIVTKYKQPIEMLSIILTKIYFPSDDIKKYISDDKYTELLKVICAEFKYYNQERNKMIDKVPEYIYDLVGYLYLLHRAIQDNVNYFAVEQNNNDKLDTELNSLKRNMKEYLQGYLNLSDEIISSIELNKYNYREILKPLVIAENIKTKKAMNKLKEMSLKNRYYHLNKSLRQLKGKIKFKEILDKLQTKIQSHTLNNLKENNKRIKFTAAKDKLEKLIKSHTLKKWQKRKNRREAKVQDNFKNISNKLLKIIWFDDIQEIVKQLKAKNAIEKIENIIIKHNRLITFHEMKNKINKKESIYMLQGILEGKLGKTPDEYKKLFIENLKKVADINKAKNYIRSLFFYILIDKAFDFRNRYEIQKKWKERYELIKARKKTKEKFQTGIKDQIQQKWKERKNKIKQREKLKEMLEKQQKKIDENKKMETLKKWNEKNKKIGRLNGILKKKVEQKQTADKNCEAIKLKKWNENAKQIKANKTEAVNILVNTFQKIKSQRLNDWKENAKRSAIGENESNKQKQSNASGKIKKIIFVAVVDLVLIVLAIIFLEEIILILALVALAIIFIVCCGFAIKNGRDYKNLGIKISAFEEKQLRLNIVPQQQIIPNRKIFEQDNLINND